MEVVQTDGDGLFKIDTARGTDAVVDAPLYITGVEPRPERELRARLEAFYKKHW
jgi:hypothetical protein